MATKHRRNNVQKIREQLLMSKAELARRAGLSAVTIDRVESGYTCRMDTKRKIILALGMKLIDKDRVFGEMGEQEDKNEPAAPPAVVQETAAVVVAYAGENNEKRD
jgi:DNA-binding XRE family transcriptional regulator